MLDTRDALSVGDAALATENPDYVNSWKVKPAAAVRIKNEVSKFKKMANVMASSWWSAVICAVASLYSISAATLQQALDQWSVTAPQLAEVYQALNTGCVQGEQVFDQAQCESPLPRCLSVGRWQRLCQSCRVSTPCP